MRKIILIQLLCIQSSLMLAQNYAFKNGNWFNGESFTKKVVYSTNGILTEKKPSKIDSTFDLLNKYVIPPFGDAHHHGIDGEEGLDQKISSFIKSGVFYVKNPNVIPDLLTPLVRSKINTPTSIDVTFSNGGITAPNGHPVMLHNFLVKGGIIKGIKLEELDGKAYFTVANEEQLNNKWPAILNGKPDFIKTFLLFSEKGNAKGSNEESVKMERTGPEGPVMKMEGTQPSGPVMKMEGTQPGGPVMKMEGTQPGGPVMKMEGTQPGGPVVKMEAPGPGVKMGGPGMRMVPGSRMEGLEPQLLKKIVEKAHSNNLKVTTHIETVQDFRIAVDAGVDEINHLPIPRKEFSSDLSAYVIDEQTAKLTAEKGVTVVATVARRFSVPGNMKPYGSEEERLSLLQNQKTNLQMLHKHGVRIAIGSDGFSGENPMMSGVVEAKFMHDNKFFTNGQLLKMMTENTAKTIFPDRKIGVLKQGYEASFLVLDENPLVDFSSINKINLRIKQGHVLLP